MQLLFDAPTDRPPGDVFDFFDFDPPLAPDTGRGWLDMSTYQLTVGDSGGGTIGDVPEAEGGVLRLLVGITRVTLKPGVIRSEFARLATIPSGGGPSGPSPPEAYAVQTNLTLSGTFGTSEAPRLVGFVPADPMNGDVEFGDGDQFHLTFDVHTSEGGKLLTKPEVDAIFSFSTPLGKDYSGEWTDCLNPSATDLDKMYCRAFVLTMIYSSQAPGTPAYSDPPIIGVTLAWPRPPGTGQAQPPVVGLHQ